MLTNDILNALKGYTANMQNRITFVVQTGEHEKRAELMEFLSSFASVSDYISVEERDITSILRSPVSFILERDGEDTGIRFSGIPGGHEFNSLVLAVLHASGTEMKLDDSIKSIVRGAKETLNFEVFISLSCHNCPEVVQALNQFALVNDKISVEMIDGGLYPDMIEERNIQGVPSVYLNGEVFANGKIDQAVLLEKLMEKYPDITQAAEPAESLPVQDVVVIGGGPAGAASAVYSARKGLKVAIIADRIGGQVKDTMGIENLISVPKTTGPELSTALEQHIKEYDVTVREHLRVASIDKGVEGQNHKIVLSSGEVIETKTVIIATGAKWRELGIPGEKENIGQGVAYCPHCDGPFFKGKDVAVIGGGNSGIEAALDLAGIVKSVTVYEFMPELKADRVLVEQASKRDNITILRNVATKEVIAEGGKVVALAYEDRDSGEIKQQALSGIFVQIGLVPNSGFLEGVVEMNAYGEVVIDAKGQTNVPGIFACGDVTTVPYKQIVIAMGEGAKASLAAFDYLLMNT
jgi:alkyl hydroperoxide reductase subunit F